MIRIVRRSLLSLQGPLSFHKELKKRQTKIRIVRRSQPAGSYHFTKN